LDVNHLDTSIGPSFISANLVSNADRTNRHYAADFMPITDQITEHLSVLSKLRVHWLKSPAQTLPIPNRFET